MILKTAKCLLLFWIYYICALNPMLMPLCTYKIQISLKAAESLEEYDKARILKEIETITMTVN